MSHLITLLPGRLKVRGTAYRQTSKLIISAEMLTPSWKFLFGGCMLNRETDKWILEGFEWSDSQGMADLHVIIEHSLIVRY